MNETVAQDEQLRRYVETHHIDMIPAGARHGKPWQQLPFWAGANINVFNVVLGGVVVAIGLTFWWAVIAIVAGTLAGALFIALHATQGPKLGVPQTIQSRGQFGFYGAAFLFPCVLLLNVGFIAAQLVIEADAGNGVISSISIPEWIVIIAVPATAIGIFGYRWIHRAMQVTVAVVGISMIVMLIQGIRFGSLPAKETSMTAPTAGLFLAGRRPAGHRHAELGAVRVRLHQVPAGRHEREAPVLDHLPRQRDNDDHLLRARRVPGRLAAANLSPVAAIGKISGKWALVMLVLSLIGSDTLNAYTGGFQVLAFGNMWRRFKSVSIWLRVVPFMCRHGGQAS